MSLREANTKLVRPFGRKTSFLTIWITAYAYNIHTAYYDNVLLKGIWNINKRMSVKKQKKIYIIHATKKKNPR